MDKYEYKVKLDQIEKLVSKKDYITAAKIADGIDWRKVKSTTTLTMVADVYEASDRLEDCYEILNMVYDRSPVGRRVVYRLAEIATRMHDFEDAIELYKEFVEIAPHDLNKYILKYQIYRERGSSVEDQILILEEYKSHEYDEKWAYELACLYEEAGQIDNCVEACDELILWFSDGEYVTKAMELKMKYQQLTATQQDKYEHRFDYLENETGEDFYYDETGTAAEENSESEISITEEAQEVESEEVEVSVEAENVSEEAESEAVTEETAAKEAESEELKNESDDTPQISVINTNKFNTLNLQEELAKGIQEFLGGENFPEEIQEAQIATTQEFIPVKEVVFEKKAEETEVVAEENISDEPEVTAEENISKEPEVIAEENAAEEPEEPKEFPGTEPQPQKLTETGELQAEILKYMAVQQEPKMEELYRTEEDGQMTLAIGENDALEKQITGQMTIGEILEAWEVTKRKAREQMELAENKKQAVLCETGEITALLQDFIPKTPKNMEEISAEEESAEELKVISEECAEEPTEVVEEAAETVEEEFVDDLPVDIDLADALEAAIEDVKVKEKNDEEEKLPEIKLVIEEEMPEAEEAAKETVGENTASMVEAIERALAANIAPMENSDVQCMTEEEQERIFAYFNKVKGMKNKLIELLREDYQYMGKTDSKEGNLIITGHPGNGKTTLAIDIVKALQRQRREKGRKLAKVTGDGFNKKEPSAVVQKLGGGALIIEHASGLKDETIEKLSEAMEETTEGLLVILEDDAEEINAMLKRHERFASKFTRFVDIPIFSNDELVAFGKSYAEEQEYYFEEMAVLALYDCIGVRQTSDHVVNITEVKEFVDDAIAHAEKKSRGIFAKLSKKRIDEFGNKLLLEEDFDC